MAIELQEVLSSGDLTNILMALGYNPSDNKQVATLEKVDAAVAAGLIGGMQFKGDYDAATNTPDLDTIPIAASNGNTYVVSAAGTFFTIPVVVGDILIANKDLPTLETDWTIVANTVDAASHKILYESNPDTNAFTDANKVAVDSLQTATTEAEGLVELATQIEVNAGLDATRAVTPATLASFTALGNIDGGRADTIYSIPSANGGNA